MEGSPGLFRSGCARNCARWGENPMPPLTETPLQLKLKDLDAAYTCIDEHKAKVYLEAHPQLVGMLAGAIRPLRRAFPGSRFMVGIDGVPSPGLEESPEALRVTIWTSSDPHDAWERQQRFYEDWWIQHYADSDGRLSFDVAFA